jgi:hypothetical protein
MEEDKDASYLPFSFLLNIVIDWIGKTAYNEPHGIRWSFISRLEDLEFADWNLSGLHLF